MRDYHHHGNSAESANHGCSRNHETVPREASSRGLDTERSGRQVSRTIPLVTVCQYYIPPLDQLAQSAIEASLWGAARVHYKGDFDLVRPHLAVVRLSRPPVVILTSVGDRYLVVDGGE